MVVLRARARSASISAATLFLGALSVGAQQDVPRGAAPHTYGTASDVTYVIPAYDFVAIDPSTVISPGTYGARYRSSGPGVIFAPVHLPNGAMIGRIEIQGCDESATDNLFATLFEHRIDSGTEVQTMIGSVTTTGSPGCNYFVSGPTPFTVDNYFGSYLMLVGFQATDATNRFTAVRIYYRLQVSPDPAVATFADVPIGHPQHRFVEALVAAGITAGCGGGNYCPTAPVTRGQMAVFLAVSLGLQWPD